MERVQGIGGFFFKAKDPKALAAWYRTHLGVGSPVPDNEYEPWPQQAGPTAFTPFPSDTSHFGRPEQAFMLNFRVGDLTAMVKQLEAAGISVTLDAPSAYGRFAHLTDPEGNPIELWQPEARPVVESAIR